MRLRNVKNAKEIVNNSSYVIKNSESLRGHFKEVFAKDNPISIEIGMGKGSFITGLALNNPDKNFIGIEMYESVLVRAIEKLENKDIPNLRLICMDANKIDEVFDHEIETIYLNFSDPWPKKRHAKRRLTSPILLNKYENIFKNNCHIRQKTDNIHLFAYSLTSLSQFGYILKDVSLDLANYDIPNIITEYEQKFMDQGVKINYLDAVKPKEK